MSIENLETKFQEFENDSTIQNLIAQADSRFILYASIEPRENFPNYSKDLDEKCLHITFSYLNMALSYFHYKDIIKSTYCFEKAAQILEHLYCYQNCRKEYKEYYILISALSYYICSQYSKSFIVLNYYSSDSNISKSISFFLRRDFNGLDKILQEIELKDIGEDIYAQEQIVYEKILSKSFLNTLKFIIDGNKQALLHGKSILKDLIEYSQINNVANLWWVFRLLLLILDEYEEASLWNVLPPIISDEAKLQKYIYTNIYRNPPVIELFKSQRDCLSSNLLNDGSIVLGMPTSSGKTKIAEITIIKTLIEFPDSLCIFIAPFRSLAQEVEDSLSRPLVAMGYNIANLYGGPQASQQDRTMVEESNVVVATPEKVKSILRSNPELERKIKLVIVDEGHLVGENARHITSELLLEELKMSLKMSSGKLLLLSAVLPNLSDFSKWVSGNEKNILDSTWRPSSQRFGTLIFDNNSVDLKWIGDVPSYNRNFVARKLKKPASKTKNGRQINAKYFPNDKKQAAAATALKMLSIGSLLIYVGRSNMVNSQAREIMSLLKHHNITHEWKNENDLKYVKLTCEEAYGEDSEIYNFILYGIICHSSKLPKDVRHSIERLMVNGNPKIIVATSTLGQGVNIGVSTVIVTNTLLDKTNSVDVKDFWNIAGRAGRAFTDTEGKILFALDKTKNNYSIQRQIASMDKYFNHSNIEKAKSGLLSLLENLYNLSISCNIDYQIFLELLAENETLYNYDDSELFRKNSADFLDLIDDTLITLNLKNSIYDIQKTSNLIEETFRESLAYIQSQYSAIITPDNVLDILHARNRGVLKIADSKKKWQSISCSSITLKASLYIDDYLDEVIEEIETYITLDLSFENLIALVKYLDHFIKSIPIKLNIKLPNVDVFTSIRDKWFFGSTLSEIKDIDTKAIDICQQYYGFHFPWIVNAISKKTKLLDKPEITKILEDICLLAEIGLPNIESAKVYIAGIKSRVCALELSKFIDLNLKESISKQLNNVYQLSNTLNYSTKSFEWLDILSLTKQKEYYSELQNIQIRIKKNTMNYEKLYVKKINSNICLCSDDYKISVDLQLDEQEHYRKLLKYNGVFFKKNSSNFWELNSQNPFVNIQKN